MCLLDRAKRLGGRCDVKGPQGKGIAGGLLRGCDALVYGQETTPDVWITERSSVARPGIGTT